MSVEVGLDTILPLIDGNENSRGLIKAFAPQANNDFNDCTYGL